MRKNRREQQGVQSVERGLSVAFALGRAGTAMSLKDLAEATSLAPSKAHRYLVSLCRSGLVSQDVESGQYQIGGAAVALGLAGQRTLNEYRFLEQAILKLHKTTDLAVGATTWGTFGPVIVHTAQLADHQVMGIYRMGSTVSLTGHASGRLYAAFMPPHIVGTMIERELAAAAHGTPRLSKVAFERVLQQVRRDRFCSVTYNAELYDYAAMAAPVFDARGDLLFTLSIVVSVREDIRVEGDLALRLKSAAAELEMALGGRLPE